MTMWTPNLSHDAGSRYEAIANAIADALVAGELLAGDRLPPQRELANRLGVTVGTVSRAYLLAEQRGLVRGEVGRGTFVRGQPGVAFDGMVAPEARSGVDLSMNMPLIPLAANELASSLTDIAGSNGVRNLLRYMPTAGHPDHRAAAARWIATSGFAPAPERIVLMEGAQQGLAAVFDILATRDRPVLVEKYTYTGLLENARLKGIRLCGVDLDDEGMLPDALERAVETTGARVVVVVPTIQNPTTSIMSEARRGAIAEVAERHGLVVVEDDVYGYLVADRPLPIAATLPERTIYITSASKCLAPGLRVGWLVSPRAWTTKFTDLVYAQSVAQPALNHEIVSRWIDDGTAARLVKDLARETAARWALAHDVLAGLAIDSHPASFHLLLTLPAPWSRDEFAAAALELGIRVTSLSAFAVEPAQAKEAVRISLVAAENRDVLARTLGKLRDLLAAGPRPSRTLV